MIGILTDATAHSELPSGPCYYLQERRIFHSATSTLCLKIEVKTSPRIVIRLKSENLYKSALGNRKPGSVQRVTITSSSPFFHQGPGTRDLGSLPVGCPPKPSVADNLGGPVHPALLTTTHLLGPPPRSGTVEGGAAKSREQRSAASSAAARDPASTLT